MYIIVQRFGRHENYADITTMAAGDAYPSIGSGAERNDFTFVNSTGRYTRRRVRIILMTRTAYNKRLPCVPVTRREIKDDPDDPEKSITIGTAVLV